METRTQIVTQLVAAMISSGMKSDYFEMVDHCIDVADYIIDETTEEIPFPETVV
jgi:hypothetical protein